MVDDACDVAPNLIAIGVGTARDCVVTALIIIYLVFGLDSTSIAVFFKLIALAPSRNQPDPIESGLNQCRHGRRGWTCTGFVDAKILLLLGWIILLFEPGIGDTCRPTYTRVESHQDHTGNNQSCHVDCMPCIPHEGKEARGKRDFNFQ